MYQLAGLEFTVSTRLARFASASVSQITSSVLAQTNFILSPPRKPSTSVLLQSFKTSAHLDTELQIQKSQRLGLPPFPPSVSSSAVSFLSEAEAFLLGSSPAPLPGTQTP